MGVSFHVLGPIEVTDDGSALAVPSGQAPQLLAVLLLHAGRVVPVGTLMDVLWDGDFPDTARKLIQVRMSQLRAALATTPVRLAGSRAGYRLDLGTATVDVDDARALLARARAADAETAEVLLGRALALWRGPAVPELRRTARGRRFATALDEEYLTATEDRAAAALTAGRGAELADGLGAVLAEHPLRERLRALLMRSLHRAGRPADAIAVFAEGRRLLADELGLDPGADLRAAHLTILAGDTDPPRSAPHRATRRPSQLPAEAGGFTGREDALARLDAILGATDRTTLASVTGTAGVGKTTLAVHWAHRHLADFPDGQLYVNLSGFDPDRPPMAPDDAVRAFVEALGVRPDEMPTHPDARAALYRSLLAGRRALIVLDNARDTDQVRPLLPGAGRCAVLATSRTYLSGLVAANGADPVTLDVLTADEAGAFLASRIGPARVAADPASAAEIVERCARLPLALAVFAARAARNPDFPLRELARELRGCRHALDAFDGGDPWTDARAVFSWSYRTLSPPATRVFRLVGTHPGREVTVPAAASRAAMPPERVRAALRELDRAHLVTETAPGRYGCHDLLRAYAGELADADGPDEVRAALERTLDHYLHTAYAGHRLLRPHRGTFRPDPPLPGVTVAELDSEADALAWFAAERRTIGTIVGLAAADGHPRQAWQLAAATADFLQRHGHWGQLVAVQQTALRAAMETGDRVGLAYTRHALAQAHAWVGDVATARADHQAALEGFTATGNVLGRAHVEMDLALMYEQQGERDAALVHTRSALAQFRAAGHGVGQGYALNNLGWLLAHRAEYDEALRCCTEALRLLASAGDRYGEANVWDSLGYIHDRFGRYGLALAAYHHAVAVFDQAGDTYYTADTLTHLGATQRRAGDHDGARASWSRALDLLDALGHVDAGHVRDLLRD